MEPTICLISWQIGWAGKGSSSSLDSAREENGPDQVTHSRRGRGSALTAAAGLAPSSQGHTTCGTLQKIPEPIPFSKKKRDLKCPARLSEPWCAQGGKDL